MTCNPNILSKSRIGLENILNIKNFVKEDIDMLSQFIPIEIPPKNDIENNIISHIKYSKDLRDDIRIIRKEVVGPLEEINRQLKFFININPCIDKFNKKEKSIDNYIDMILEVYDTIPSKDRIKYKPYIILIA